MGILLDRLAERKLLVSDGAFGTMLQGRGLKPGDCPEEWNISHATDVKSVAGAYTEAGSDMILTNTLGGSRIKLQKNGWGDRVVEFNATAARHSLEMAGSAIVAGSVGPTGEFLAPLGQMNQQDAEAVFAEQIEAMLNAGLRVICVETMMAVEEAASAVRAAKKLDSSVDVLATMTFDRTPKGFRTMMGVDPQAAVVGLLEAGADVVGSNCGNGIEAMVELAAALQEHTDKPILIHPNAGLPQLVDGKTVFQQGPADFASSVKPLIEAGANIVGGCCGTTPEHIKAIKAVVDTMR